MSFATKGKRQVDWAKYQMPVLSLIQKEFSSKKPLKGIRVGACLHITKETAVLMLTLKAGGAQVS